MNHIIDTLPCGCKLNKEDWLYKILNRKALSLNQSKVTPLVVERPKLLKTARMKTGGSAPKAKKPKIEVIVISDSE